ncbi:hypothetical protein HDU89_007259 [Geranomyces variabilis]|nr:hypothetical protein HDU89_007259 [Geranomyces variabilis]
MAALTATATAGGFFESAVALVSAKDLLDSDRTALLGALIAQSDDVDLHTSLAANFAWDGCSFGSPIDDWHALIELLRPPPIYSGFCRPTSLPSQGLDINLTKSQYQPPSAAACRALSEIAWDMRDASIPDSEKSSLFADLLQACDECKENWMLHYELRLRFGWNGLTFEPPIQDWTEVVRFVKPALKTTLAADGSVVDPWKTLVGHKHIRDADHMWDYVERHNLCSSGMVHLNPFLYSVLIAPIEITAERFREMASELTYPIPVIEAPATAIAAERSSTSPWDEPTAAERASTFSSASSTTKTQRRVLQLRRGNRNESWATNDMLLSAPAAAPPPAPDSLEATAERDLWDTPLPGVPIPPAYGLVGKVFERTTEWDMWNTRFSAGESAAASPPQPNFYEGNPLFANASLTAPDLTVRRTPERDRPFPAAASPFRDLEAGVAKLRLDSPLHDAAASPFPSLEAGVAKLALHSPLRAAAASPFRSLEAGVAKMTLDSPLHAAAASLPRDFELGDEKLEPTPCEKPASEDDSGTSAEDRNEWDFCGSESSTEFQTV